MKVVRFDKVDGGKLHVTVKCQGCGKLLHTETHKLTELKDCVCDKCGDSNREYRDGLVFGGTAALTEFENTDKNVVTKKRSDGTHVRRLGISRMIFEFNRLNKHGAIAPEAFEDREDFVRWSIENGYRDWKVLVAGAGKELIDRDGAWVPKHYKIKAGNNKNILEAYVDLANISVNCVRDARDLVDEALEREEASREKFGEEIDLNDDIVWLRTQLLSTRAVLNELVKQIDKRFV